MFDMFGNENAIGTRRLPIYLLLDTSSSMGGTPIQAVNQGIKLLYDELYGNPQALETVFIAIIEFESDAKLIMPLTALGEFSPPTLKASGSTSLGEALKVLNKSLDADIIENTPNQKGDYKPLVFLLTDGAPTDDWKAPLQKIRERKKNKVGSIIGLGCGGGSDLKVLKEVADVTLLMKDVTADSLQAFFKWVSASISTASVSAAQGQGGTMQAPPLPSAANIEVIS